MHKKKRFQYCIWLEIQRFTWRIANEKQRDRQTSGNRIFGRVLFCISISTRLQYTFLLSLVQTFPFCVRHFLQHNWFGFRMSLNIKLVPTFFFVIVVDEVLDSFFYFWQMVGSLVRCSHNPFILMQVHNIRRANIQKWEWGRVKERPATILRMSCVIVMHVCVTFSVYCLWMCAQAECVSLAFSICIKQPVQSIPLL